VKIKTDEIASVIRQEIEQYSQELEVSEVGRVVEVGDGIARVYGLSMHRACLGSLPFMPFHMKYSAMAVPE